MPHIQFHLLKQNSTSNRPSAYVPALLAFARLNVRNPSEGLPITLAMVEGAEAQDLEYSNYEYERAFDVLDDMCCTIERRIPGNVTIERDLTGEGLIVRVEVT